MRKKSITLVALLSMLLVGCTDNSNKNSTKPSAEPSISEKASATENKPTESKPSEKPTVKPSESPTVKPSENPGSASNEKPSDSVSPSVSPSESDDQKSKWPSKVQSVRKQYLGGQLLPYISLGSGVSALNVQFDVNISGDAPYDDTLKNSFKAAFTADGYTVDDTETNQVSATNETKHLSVVLKEDTDLEIACLIASYDEPYEPSKLTAYPSSVRTDLKSSLGGHENDVPVVYLGTVNPISEITDSGDVNIYGRNWIDDRPTDAKTTLTNNGFKVTKISSYSNEFTAEKAFSDGNKLTISISKEYKYDFGGYVPQRSVSLGENFDPTAASDWTEDIKQYFTAKLDGHTVPYVYLGSKAPTAEWENGKLTLTGKVYDDQVFTLAKTAFGAGSGWTITEDNTSSSYDPSLTATIKESDKCRLTVKVSKDYAPGSYSVYCPKREVAILEHFDPESFTAYPEDLKAALDRSLDGHQIPVIYLGTDTPAFEESSYSDKVSLTGGNYVEEIKTGAEAVLSAAEGWKKTSYSYSSDLTYEKTFEDNDKITITVGENYSGLAEMDVERKAGWYPEGRTEYSADIKQLLNEKFDNHGDKIPFVYLGCNKFKTEWKDSIKQLTLFGKTTSGNIILDKAKEVFASWTNTSTTATTATYVTTRTDGCVLAVEVWNTSTPRREISRLTPSKDTAWSSETDATIKSLTANHEIPYFYRGNVTNRTNSSSDPTVVGLSGDTLLDDKEFYLFEKAFVDWEITKGYSSRTAKKVFEDGYTIFVTLEGKNYSSALGGSMSALSFRTIAPYNKDSYTAYTGKAKDAIDKLFGDKASLVPVIYLGTNDPTTDSYGNYVTLTGTGWDDKVITDNEATLKAAGFTTFYTEDVNKGDTKKFYGYGKSIQAYKAIGDDPSNGYIRLAIASSSLDVVKKDATVRFWYDKAVTIPSTDVKWAEDDANSTLREGQLYDTLPYFYRGSNVTVKKASEFKGITVTGSFTSGEWNNSYLRNAREALKSQKGAKVVDASVDLSQANGAYFVLEGKNPDGDKILYTLSCTSTKLTLDVELVEEYNPTGATSYNATVKSAISTALDGNDIPYLYLGSNHLSYTEDEGKIVLQGKYYEEHKKDYFTLAESTLNDDTAHTWEVVTDGESLLFASAKLENGKSIYIKLTLEGYSSIPTLTVSLH